MVSGCFLFTMLTIYVSLTNENKHEFFNNLSTRIGMRSVVGTGMKKIRVSCVGWKPSILPTAAVPLGSLVWLFLAPAALLILALLVLCPLTCVVPSHFPLLAAYFPMASRTSPQLPLVILLVSLAGLSAPKGQ